MEETLRRLGEVRLAPLPGDSAFVRPGSVYYHLDGAPALAPPRPT